MKNIFEYSACKSRKGNTILLLDNIIHLTTSLQITQWIKYYMIYYSVVNE
jgi:hypothetical protein